MKTIHNAAHNVAALIRDRHPERAEDCRRSIYAVEADCPDGKLLYHTLSGELLLLEPGEDPDAPALRRELTERRFLVPRTLDEKKLCDQTRNVLRLTQSESGHVTSYVVFTTTDCNARCYYCFERGQRRLTMSAETADDVAAWMLAHCGGEDITVRWFGGEPLVNVGAIDRISRTLRDSGASYRSVMFSNAFLFTPELVKRAAELWQLRQVVVTLDGTEEVYNHTKARDCASSASMRKKAPAAGCC